MVLIVLVLLSPGSVATGVLNKAKLWQQQLGAGARHHRFFDPFMTN